MFKRKNGQKGFTLIELMIVVVIIGILAALAIPRFMRATTKSKQSEGKQILKQVYVMQQAYRQEKDVYWPAAAAAFGSTAAGQTAWAALGVDIGPNARYTYTMVAGSFTFTATATSGILDDDATVDIWTITETGSLVVTPGNDDAVN